MRSNYSLSAVQKQAARSMFSLLEGSGISPEEAAKRALAGRRAVKRVSVEECMDQYLKATLTRVRPHTFSWYSSKLGIFGQAFKEYEMDGVSRQDFRTWLEGQPVSLSTKMAYTRAVGAMWRWALAHEPPMAAFDVTLGLSVSPKRAKEIHFLPVKEVEQMLELIPPQHLAAVCVSLFAGIRPHEVSDPEKTWLKYSAFNHAEKMIRIPAEVAKTGMPRILEGLPDTLWHWLPKKRSATETIACALPPEVQEKAAAAAGYGERCARIRKWPHDALRHTFATYALAYTDDAAKVSKWLGHEGKPSLLYRAYAGLATKAEATKFFSLRPPTD